MSSGSTDVSDYKLYLDGLDWEAIHMAFMNRNRPKFTSIRSLVSAEVLESPRSKFFKTINALLVASSKFIPKRAPTDVRDISRLLSQISSSKI